MRRSMLAAIVAVAGLLGMGTNAEADPSSPPCPSGPLKQEFTGELGPNSTSVPYVIDLKPCETVLVQLIGSASSHPSGNANMQLIVRNSDGAALATTNFLCGQSCTTTAPLAGSVPGYPLPGTRGPGGLAKDVIVKVGVFNWFGRPPATYKLIVLRSPRPGYNTAGNGFDNALDVSLPATQLGSIHPFDPGQYVKVRLEAHEALYASGHVKGHSSYGSYWEIEVYDDAGAKLTNLAFGTAYGGPHHYASRSPFTNVAAEPRDFYVRIWCRFWPLHEFSMNLVQRPATTEVTEVGFKLDHPITRWEGLQPIDPQDGTEPTWIKGRSDQEERYPAAYTKGSHPTLFAVVSLNPAYSSETVVSVRVKRDGMVVGTRDGLRFNGSTGRVDSLQLDVPLESSPGVKESNYRFDWELSRDNGATWLPIGQTGRHRIYWTYAQPFLYPFTNQARHATDLFRPTYDLALEKATDAADGRDDVAEIMRRVNRAMSNIPYTPNSGLGDQHPLRVYRSRAAQCDDLAHLMRGLLRSVGIDIQTYYLWGGGGGATGPETYWYKFGPATVSLMLQRPAKSREGFPGDPHFTFHAFTGAAATGLIYDPTYGIEKTAPDLGVIETADGPHGTPVRPPAPMRQMLDHVLVQSPQLPPLQSCIHGRFAGPFAGFVDQALPAAASGGELLPVTVTFRNTGTDPWFTTDGISLGPADAETAAVWGSLSVPLPAVILPDEEVTFTFSLTAPMSSGSYPVSFGLQQNGTSFGAQSHAVTVVVQ